MQNEIGTESADDSNDSIPRPEYEAVAGGDITQSSAAELVQGNKLDGSERDARGSVSGRRVRRESFCQDGYLDTSDELLEEEIGREANSYKRYKFDGVDEDINKFELRNETKTIQIQPTCSQQLVQAKTKGNTVLLVQLVDENGKTLRQPVRSVNHVSKSDAAPPTNKSSTNNSGSRCSPQTCSSPSLSREFVALQKSVNDSKILTKFVADITVEKARKRKSVPLTLETVNKNDSKSSSDLNMKLHSKSYITANHVAGDEAVLPIDREDEKSMEKIEPHTTHWQTGNQVASSAGNKSSEKPRKTTSSKFVPLKDESASYTSDAGRCASAKRRSRSKSVNRKFSEDPEFDSTMCKPKRHPSEENQSKRTNMRSQNSEFVKKQIDFLDQVKRHGDDVHNEGDDNVNCDDAAISKDKHSSLSMTDGENLDATVSAASDISLSDGVAGFLGHFPSVSSGRESPHSQISSNATPGTGNTATLEKYLESVYQPPPKRGWDSFCWKCRHGVDLLPCSKCVRCFHPTCIKITAATKLDKTWMCPECVAVETVLSGPKRTRRSDLSLDMLSQLLAFALKRMRHVKGMPQFMQSLTTISNYPNYFVNPVSFATLQEKIDKKVFRCAEEFVNETKWMQHNALIAAGGINNKDIVTARAILKICRQETNEIDTCPECYHNANTRHEWFVDVCSQPHLLLWAKLKGFPYWPAKAMGPGQGGHVNVRFFGEHDRAFVPIKDCYLFSEEVPNAQTGRRSARAGFAECIQEVKVHIENIRSKIGEYKYAPYKTLYDPVMELQQLEAMMPGVQEYIKRQQSASPQKPSLQYKIVRTADDNLSIIKKGTTDSGTESDHSLGKTAAATAQSSHGKKKLQDHTEASNVELNRNVKSSSTPNYEVICKIDDQDNSSKVNSVILKRKSEYGDATSSVRRAVDAVDTEQPLSKMTRVDKNMVEDANAAGKRNFIAEPECKKENVEKHSVEQTNQKQSSVIEPKVPVLTIKTNGSKVAEKGNASKATEAVAVVTTSENSVKNLVKFKQGVTIKKLTKEDVKRKHTETLSPAKAKKESATKNIEATQVVKEKSHSDSSKSKNELQGKGRIQIDLVPFVEIKKEHISEYDIAVGKKILASNAVPVATGSSPAEAAAIDTESIQSSPPDSVNSAPSVPGQTAALTESPNSGLGSVKQELLSDEDSEPAVPAAKDSDKVAQPSIDKSPVVVATSLSPGAPVESVRVVGDTTIQRVPTKLPTTTTATTLTNTPSTPDPTPQPQAAPSVVSTAAAPSTASIFTSMSQAGATTSVSKRPTGRGIPYGPLPASAASTSKASSNLETSPLSSPGDKPQQKQKPRADQQRARKSFPNRSPSEASPVRGVVVTPPASAAASISTTNATDPKRALTNASMVSIPADVANNRLNSTAVVPVPPLTAVTKVLPITCTPSTAVTSSVNASASSFLTCNGSTASIVTSLSAPPPLAGLSYSTFASTSATATVTSASSVQIMNGAVPNSPVSSASNYSAENPAVNDFVTPTMASAITEAICRGPPRMVPRPTGPLQSDGSTLFPSQAGPVCRTLVENAHKLTDFFISVMEDTMSEMSAEPEPVLQAKISLLSLELERTKQNYERELSELRRTSDLMICEMRKSMENEKNRITCEVRKQCELERKRSVEETKKKQWCSNCGRESQFHCCWNTSYCDYPCQQLHWSRHASSCAQTRPTSEAVAQGVAATNQMERHHTNSKSLATFPTNTSHYSSKAGVHSKKEKSLSSKSGATVVVSNANSATAEVLKLPTNTYLRPVSSTTSVRTPYPTQAPVQRFNIPLPIPAPANPGPYTLVQREGNWELMSAVTSKSSIASPIAMPINVPSQQATVSHQHHSRLASSSAALTTKSAARARGGINMNTSSAALQPLGTHFTGTMQCSGAIRSTQM